MRAEVRLYENLFTVPDPSDVPEGVDYKVNLNPKSLEVLPACYVEPSLRSAKSATDFNSSGSAISRLISILRPESPRRTVQCRSAIRGRRSRRGREASAFCQLLPNSPLPVY